MIVVLVVVVVVLVVVVGVVVVVVLVVGVVVVVVLVVVVVVAVARGHRQTGCSDSSGVMLLIQFNVGFTEVVRTVRGERGLISNPLYCHHQNDFYIKVGSDVSHFNISFIVQGKVTRQCP